MKAIIVGGGVGGLTTALMLRARGINCELYEQSDSIRELGVGINTLPHAIRELAGLGLLDRLDAVAIRTDEHLAQLAALRAGLGIGVCASQLAQGYGLVRVLPEQVNFSIDVWIAMHEDLRRVQRVALVFDALGESLKGFLQP